MKKIIGIILVLFWITGCASRARDHSIDEAQQLAIGHSMKSDVLTCMGLPNEKIESTLEDGSAIEIWTYYQDGDETLILPVGGTMSTGTTLVFAGGMIPLDLSDKEVAGILIFDSKGKLIEVTKPKKNKE